MPKDSTYEFQKVFAELNASNRQYALAVLRSLLFAQEEKKRDEKAETAKIGSRNKGQSKSK